MGNIHSVKKAFEVLGEKVLVTSEAETIRRCEKIVLPGVGAFDDAMIELKKRSLTSLIRDEIDQKKTLLGICLGMQLLFETSQEAEGTKGLAIFKGKVSRFRQKAGYKVPHIGWNELTVQRQDCPLLYGIGDGSFVYFCHSYYAEPKQKQDIAATTKYATEFSSLTWKDNVFGVQFHPEKSQTIGLKILRNFIEL